MALLGISEELKQWLAEHPEVNYETMMVRFDKLVEDADEQETPSKTE